MFTDRQKEMLKAVGRKPNHPDFGKANPQLDRMIEILKLEASISFLTDDERNDRVFYHKPKNSLTTPYADYREINIPVERN